MAETTGNSNDLFNISDEQYDNFFKKTGYGFVAGGVLGLITMRRPYNRVVFASFGAGFGAGVGFMDYKISKKGLDYRDFSCEVPALPKLPEELPFNIHKSINDVINKKE